MSDNLYRIRPAMDIFSLGCVLYELFAEEHLFNLDNLLEYRSGNMDSEHYLWKIKQTNIKQILILMLDKNPEKRPTIFEVFKLFSEKLCPLSFSKMMVKINYLMVINDYWKPDKRIGLIYKHWDQIWKVIQLCPHRLERLQRQERLSKELKEEKKEEEIEINTVTAKKEVKEISIEKKESKTENTNTNTNTSRKQSYTKQEHHEKQDNNDKDVDKLDKEPHIPELNQTLNPGLLNEILTDIPFVKFQKDDHPIIFDLLNYKEILLSNEEIQNFISNAGSRYKEEECALLFINLILTSMLYCKYASTSIVAIEMIRHFSERITDLKKIQLVVPYLVKMLKYGNNNLVKITAINEILHLLSNIDADLILPSRDYNIFNVYVFPSILELCNEGDCSVILHITNILGKLCELGNKFLEIDLHSKDESIRLSLPLPPVFNSYLNTLNQTPLVQKRHSKMSTTNLKANELRRQKLQEEMIYNYDKNLYEFKRKLFECVEDIISGYSNNVDIQINLIRNIPSLIHFYGKREVRDFIFILINFFNKNDWVLQREALNILPKLTEHIVDNTLREGLIECIDGMITKNANEIKVYDLINIVKQLLEVDFLPLNKAIQIYIKLLPFIIHPNILIEDKFKEFSQVLFKKIPKISIISDIAIHIKPYLKREIINFKGEKILVI